MGCDNDTFSFDARVLMTSYTRHTLLHVLQTVSLSMSVRNDNIFKRYVLHVNTPSITSLPPIFVFSVINFYNDVEVESKRGFAYKNEPTIA